MLGGRSTCRRWISYPKGYQVTYDGVRSRKQYLDYFTSLLNSLGFKATEKVINSSVYFTTIGAPTSKPQFGFADWNQDFPHPWDFMKLFSTSAADCRSEQSRAHRHCHFVGTHQHHRAGDILIGSVAERLIRLAPCTVVVVKRSKASVG